MSKEPTIKGAEMVEFEGRLEQLRQQAEAATFDVQSLLAELESLDAQLSARAKEIGLKMKDGSATPEEKQLIRQLSGVKRQSQVFAEKVRPVEEVNMGDEIQSVWKEQKSKGEKLDDALVGACMDSFEELPEELRAKYFEKLKKELHSSADEVRRHTGLRGIYFEMNRINTAVSQSLEKVEFSEREVSVEYTGYVEALDKFKLTADRFESLPEKLKKKIAKLYEYDEGKGTWQLKDGVGLGKAKSIFKEPEMAPFLLSQYHSGRAVTESKTSSIEMDVPIVRETPDGEEIPYVYDTKSYSRKVFGQLASNYNQLLKYNEAVEEGKVDGATIEIDGRIDPNFLKWAAGESVYDNGAVPNVELVYNLPLPSGLDYRFVLKRGAKDNGLNFTNPDREYSEEEKFIISGVQKGIMDKGILEILSQFDESDFDEDLKPFLDNPGQITDLDTFQRFNKQRTSSLWKRLLERHDEDKLNTENKKNAYSEYANPEFVDRTIREYQAYLRANPQMMAIKKSYVLQEEQIPAVLDKVMQMIETVKTYETERHSSAVEKERQADRVRLGYKGRPEGVSLDIEHFIIDAIQDVTKEGKQRGRSYENPSRFRTFEQITDAIQGEPSQRTINVRIFDPIKGKYIEQSGLSQIKKLGAQLVTENLQRAERRVSELEDSGERATAREMAAKRIEKLKQKIKDLGKEKGEAIAAAKKEAELSRDYSVLKEVSADFGARTLATQEALIKVYIEVMGGDKEYEKIEKRVTSVEDVDMVKYIYAVTAEGEIIMDEEKKKAEVSGRAAHSELSSGRNIYGAGEIAFAKHRESFSSYEEWLRFNEDYDPDIEWHLSEINNGSGHYRPSPDTLDYVKSLVVKKAQNSDLNTSGVMLVDSIMRGVKLREAGVFS
jgi:hypothetical protein